MWLSQSRTLQERHPVPPRRPRLLSRACLSYPHDFLMRPYNSRQPATPFGVFQRAISSPLKKGRDEGIDGRMRRRARIARKPLAASHRIPRPCRTASLCIPENARLLAVQTAVPPTTVRSAGNGAPDQRSREKPTQVSARLPVATAVSLSGTSSRAGCCGNRLPPVAEPRLL